MENYQLTTRFTLKPQSPGKYQPQAMTRYVYGCLK